MPVMDEDGEVVRNEDGTQVGSVDVSLDDADDDGGDDEDLSKLSKVELQERAEAAGIDTAGLLKADLLELLEEEGDDDGDNSVP